MYKLYAGVNYALGPSVNHDEVTLANVTEVALAISKLLAEEPDAVNFVFTVVAPEV